ncbi:MAG: methionine--tRNA ligase, partial [Gemmatimonadales bacterium]
GLYCTGCEEFKQPAQVVDGHCIEHPTLDLVPTRETNHFFRLSGYTDRLHSLITSGELAVEPAIRRNEILRLLEGGLQDISISRSRFPWGIPFPGDPDHTVYVWFDALINYLSATGFPEEGYERLWPADLHIVGKGITRFHCVIWPAMLLAAELPLPRKVWAHGYVQWEGTKMSKTAGTAVSLQSAMDRHGADALRYFLLREVGFEQDGNFSWERFDERYTADLADGLGNLASRSLAMLVKYREGIVPEGAETELDQVGESALEAWGRAMDELDLRGGAEAAGTLVAAANSYITRMAPWTLAKEGKDRELDAVMTTLARCLARLTCMLGPFMPSKSAELRGALGYPPGPPETALSLSDISTITGQTVRKPDNLFPRPVI